MEQFTSPQSSSLDFSVLEPELRKNMVVDFSGGDLSTDGGALLLAQVDRMLGLSTVLAAAIKDKRHPGKVRHSLVSMLRTRIGGIAMDYVDCNDAEHLRFNPALALFVGKVPMNEDLPTTATLSRLENCLSRRDLLELAKTLAQTIVGQLPVRSGGKRQGRCGYFVKPRIHCVRAGGQLAAGL